MGILLIEKQMKIIKKIPRLRYCFYNLRFEWQGKLLYLSGNINFMLIRR